MIRVAYDGTDFHGWQYQPETRTVEGELNRAIKELTGEEIQVIGASRTDAGVHALGNVAVFDTDSTIPPERFFIALNTKLPEDVKVVSSRETDMDFHPRKTEVRKTYEYRIYNSDIPNPLKRRDYWTVPYKLDIEKMREAASYLVGTHDFATFCSVHTQAESTVRTIYDITITGGNGSKADSNYKTGNKEKEFESNTEIKILVTGNGFLYNMIRIIAGTLVEVGRGSHEPSWVSEILSGTDRTLGGPTAPPQGLCLMKIDYGDKV